MNDDDIYCQSFNGAYLEFAVTLPIIIISQLFLLFKTIHTEYTQRNSTPYKKISKELRILFIALQCIGLSWTVVDFIRLVIDPFTMVLRNNMHCAAVAFAPKVLPVIYYGVYCYQVLIRLISSFKRSYLALNKCIVYTLYILVFFPSFLFPALFFWMNRDHSSCIAIWHPVDISHNEGFSFCALPISKAASNVITIGILWVVMVQIILGTIFSLKLKKILSDQVDYQSSAIKFKTLIIKNTLLTLTGTISTVGSWMLWLGMQRTAFGATFLYLELFINCLVIFMMFKHNEWCYKRVCRCCVFCCLIDCDKSKDRMREEDVAQYVDRELSISSTSSLSRMTHSFLETLSTWRGTDIRAHPSDYVRMDSYSVEDNNL
eukprot:193533_1